ncbi:hypothetical protein [Salinibacterium sp. ZJ77]|uniref:hypothetical protein n=1 Tax=Salinibacterium sp. ZJ77 TaxID=2708337 RepID=UPI001423423C|nr:hypothetical protein [Salinibacterium sp. ZJ77]
MPKGTPVLWAEDVSVFGGSEREVLLGRGLNWTATGSVKIDGQWHVYAEVTA